MQVKLKEVIKLLDEKGYNPSEQLKGYIILGNARELVKKINKSDIIDYLRGLNI